MIENEESPTVQRTISQQSVGDATANSQVSTATNTDIDANTISTSSPAQQAPQPAALPYMTVGDVLALKIASDPRISPDGTLIAYTVLQCNGDTNATSSAIWLVDNGAGKDAAPVPPVQLTSGEYHDTALHKRKQSYDDEGWRGKSNKSASPICLIFPSILMAALWRKEAQYRQRLRPQETSNKLLPEYVKRRRFSPW